LASADTSKSKDSTLAKSKKDTSKTKGKKAKEDNPEHPLFTALHTQGDSNSAKRPVIGTVKISDTASVNKLLRLPAVKGVMPPQIIFAWDAKPQGTSDYLELYALKGTEIGHAAVLYGAVVTDARQDVDPKTNGYIVDMQMNSKGA